MLVRFEMISENMNINFKAFGKKENNILSFPDKSVSNTMMFVTINHEEIEIVRNGNVNMRQTFKLNTKTTGYYRNSMGIEFKIASYTKELTVTENSITILYEHYLDNNWQSSNKLKILF